MKAKCKKCGDTVEVTRPREFKSCKCGAINLDYGDGYYYRVGGNPEDFDGEIEGVPELNDDLVYRPKAIKADNRILIDSNPIETCEAKVAYLTINKARKAKRQIEKNGSVMDIYKCPHCKHYHLTSVERN